MITNANAWTPSPSPALEDALASSPSHSALMIALHIAAALPRRLWHTYVAYLWNYQPESWVGRVASTFRILAVMLVLPVVLLTLLDVSAYVIARTLGVVDHVKASTSDADTARARGAVPMACTCSAVSATATASLDEGGVVETTDGDGRGGGGGKHPHTSETAVGRSIACTLHARVSTQTQIQTEAEAETGSTSNAESLSDTDTRRTGLADEQAYYFAGEEDLRLAGEGVFSPAVSVPPSPLTPRMPLHALAFTTESDGGREVGLAGEEVIMLRRRAQGAREDARDHAR